jgi:hypothetical protein
VACERIPLDRGVTIYRRKPRGPWWLDLALRGTRERRSLATTDRAKALALARDLAASALGRRWNVRLARATAIEAAIEGFREEYESLHPSEATRLYTRLTFKRSSSSSRPATTGARSR